MDYSPEPLIVSVSGIRGIAGVSLTADVAGRFAAAFGTVIGSGTVVVSSDGRPSGHMLRHAVFAGILGSGRAACDLGILPTPTCGLAIRRLRAAGGIQITASHNPARWNGLKLFGADGRVLSASLGRQVQHLSEEPVIPRVTCNDLDSIPKCPDAPAWHRERILELVDVPQIRAAGLRVFLDANGGAGGPLGRDLLAALGCWPTCHACDADGVFRHEPEPTAANLTAICPLVPAHYAQAGFVLDPDADRLALIDETGRYLGEELTLALALRFRLAHEPIGGEKKVVINMSTSRVTEDVARRFGATCERSAVGEANVADRMQAVNAVIGGEGNGGVIDPRVGYVRDPFIGMALILNLMAETGRTLSELADELPVYAIVKDKYPADPTGLPALFQKLESRWPDAIPNHLDGLRLDWPDRWVHVRPSNTEPIVRVIAEALRPADAQDLCRQVGALIRSE